MPSAGPARRSFQVDPKDVFTGFGNRILSLEAEDKMVCMDKTRIKSNETPRRGRQSREWQQLPPTFSVNDILLFILFCENIWNIESRHLT
jgi:hypothetical protein